MTQEIRHEHVPIFRVVRKGWADPIDTTFSQHPKVSNRWNTAEFPALYCCCSETVARAIVRDVFALAGVDLEDLQDDSRPQLVEVHWTGGAVDMISPSGVTTAGFPGDYPKGVGHAVTQPAATGWHSQGFEAVVCRSASRSRLGFNNWVGDHQQWSEFAIFTDIAVVRPSVLRRRLTWIG